MTRFRTARQLSAKPATVFVAIREPERLAPWWGPSGFTNSFETSAFEPDT